MVVSVNNLFGQFKIDIAKFKSGAFGENPSPDIERSIREKARLLKSAFNIDVTELGFNLNELFKPGIQMIDVEETGQKKTSPLLIPALVIGALLLL